MKSIKGKYFIISGAVLLLAALSLILYNVHEDRKSGEYAETVLAELKIDISEAAAATENIEEEITEPVEDVFSKYEEEPTEPLDEVPETIEIDGESYIGILQIPSLGIELPVMAEWSYPNLKKSPCRYVGNPNSKNLIIAAHNYSSHFGRISELRSGDEILFTDVNGKVFRYSVAMTENIGGKDVEAMMKDIDDNWQLTLFTCTLGGQSRVSVRAEEIEASEGL